MNLDDLKRRVRHEVHMQGVPTNDLLCSCANPCCEVDIGVGYVNCGAQHCPVHATAENQGMPSYDTYTGRPMSSAEIDQYPAPYAPPRRPDKVNGVPLHEVPGAQRPY